MATVEFDVGGDTYQADVPESFFALDEEEQRRRLMALMGGDQQEDKGIWESTKDVGKAVGGGMLSALHQLGRPQSAIAGGLYNIQEEMAMGDDDGRSDWDRYVTETLEGMKKGFTYEDEKRIQDLIAQGNPEWVKQHPILSTVLGFAGDVITDPLNLLGIGLVRQAISAPARGIAAAINKTPAGAAIASAADNPVLRAFNVYTGDKKKARDLYVQMLDDIRGSQGIIGRGQKFDTKVLKETAKRLGVSVDDLERQILREAEGAASAAAAVPPSLTGAARVAAEKEAKGMKDIFGKFLAEEQKDIPLKIGGKEGGFIPGADIQDIMVRSGDLGDIEAYVPHILSKAGRKQTETLRDTFRHHPSMIKRQHGGTVEDVNLRFGDNFFITDVPAIKGVRAARHAQVVAGKNFLKETAEQLGRLVDDAPADWVPINGIEGVMFDPEIAPFINKMYQTIYSQKELGKFLKFTDGATRWWKMWSLGLRPAYHARNVVGNLWNAYNIGGMSPGSARRFTQAGLIQQQSLRGKGFSGTVNIGGKFKNSKGKDYTREEVWEMAMEDGVLNHGQYGADVGRNIERYAVQDAPRNAVQRLSEWVTPSTKNRLLRGGFATGRALENNTRLALYLDTLAKTGSRDVARANVKKSLFDYGDLSPFEQDVMKRFIPFYTWSRKNIPAQIEALIKNPQRAERIGHLIDNIQYGIDTPSLDEVNEFVRGRDPVFVDKFFEGGGGDVHNVITLMNWLPLMDVDRLLDWKPMREGKIGKAGTPFPTLLAEMTNPYLKSMVEWGLNYDIYRRRDIQDYPKETVDFLGISMPVHLAKLAQNLVMLSEIDRLNPMTKPSRFGGRAMFGEATRTPEGTVKRTRAAFKPPWQEEATWRESRVDQPISMRLLQYLVGLRPYEAKEDAKKWENMRMFKDYKELISLLRKAAMSNKYGKIEEIKRVIRNMSKTMEGR